MQGDFAIESFLSLWRILAIVCPLVFFAGFVDAVAGGGGVISLPAYLVAGLPAHFAAGTNKMANGLGTAMAVWKYMKGGKILWRVALFSTIGSLLGSAIGTRIALSFPENTLRMVMIAAIPLVAVFMLVKKDFGSEARPERELSSRASVALSFAIGLVIGCYDGLVGPGTGTFLILAYTGILGMDMLLSSGCAKVANLASNVASMVVYLIGGKIVYLVALPAAVFSIAGNYLGARFALKNGSGFIRKMMFLVLALLLAKLIWDIIA
ncbi:MAG: sulfite exporter TauE/SafE family protein [Christensenellales bacterium]|jgi:uncharacterized membrane protein YfcA